MSKLSIFDSAWTDMVFEGRNKDYGAYQLRKENPKTTIIALLTAFALLGVALAIPSIAGYFGPPAITAEKAKDDDPTIHIIDYYVKPPANPDTPKPVVHEAPPIKQPVTPPQGSLAHVQLTENHTEAVQPANPQTETVIDNPATPSGGPAGNTGGVPGTTRTDTGPEAPSGPMLVDAADVKPEFPGGMDKFYKYVGRNFKAPEDNSVAGSSLKVIVYFVIEKDGSMTDIKVLRNPGYGMDKEAIRVLKSINTKWKPGRYKGQEVRIAYTLPITVQAPQ